jgi:hypothetical protein
MPEWSTRRAPPASETAPIGASVKYGLRKTRTPNRAGADADAGALAAAAFLECDSNDRALAAFEKVGREAGLLVA